MATLLEKAKKEKPGGVRTVSKEHVELAVAWAKNEVTYDQVRKALKMKHGSAAYITLARGLKEAYQKAY